MYMCKLCMCKQLVFFNKVSIISSTEITIPKNFVFKDVLKSQEKLKFKTWINGKNEVFTM